MVLAYAYGVTLSLGGRYTRSSVVLKPLQLTPDNTPSRDAIVASDRIEFRFDLLVSYAQPYREDESVEAIVCVTGKEYWVQS